MHDSEKKAGDEEKEQEQETSGALGWRLLEPRPVPLPRGQNHFPSWAKDAIHGKVRRENKGCPAMLNLGRKSDLW